MKRWIALAAELYPRSWREQYGEEFGVLLDDVRPSWRVFANVLRGAITMQMTKETNWLKLAACMSVAGAIVAVAVSFTVPPRYVSSAIIQVTPQPDPLRPTSSQAIQERAAEHFGRLELWILSRNILTPMILDPAFDLYKKERQRMPVEDIVARMRQDIRIGIQEPSSPSLNGVITPMTFSVSFAYPDRVKAQAVVNELVTKFGELNRLGNGYRGRLYEQFWKGEIATHNIKSVPPAPLGETLSVLAPASLPRKSVGPGLVLFLMGGLGAGLLLGLLAALAMRRSGGFWLLGGFATAGFVLATAASLLIPDRYTSTAVMRISPPEITEDPTATTTSTRAAERLPQWEPEILSRSNLARLIQNPRFNLYPKERGKKPLDEVIENMRTHDIRIAVLKPVEGAPWAASSFSISYSHSDRFLAQAVVRQLVAYFEETKFAQGSAMVANASPTLQHIVYHKMDENLEVIEPASLPESPATPDHLTIAASGLGMGLFLGAITLWIRRPGMPTLQPA
jgi:uncharacterized protein involved in exopolysaccharide biosynthesis